jgi:integrase
MANIRERTRRDGTVVYNVQVRLAGFPDRTATFSTRDKAKKWARLIEGEMEEGKHFRSAEAKRKSLGDAIDRYFKDELPKKRDGEMHRTTLKWWKAELGHLKLAHVTPAILVEYRDKLKHRVHRKKKLTASRVNRYVACLRHLFSVARREWHWISYNPMDGVSMLPEGKGRMRSLNDDERKALLAETAKDPVLHTFVLIALSTACRAGELQKLTWADVDLKAGRLLFRETKNAQPRAAWLTGAPLELLKAHGKVRKLQGVLVFEGKGTKPYDYHKPYRAAVDAAGIENLRFHDLRHTAATYLAQQGATEQQLRAIGGWKSNIVSRYVHLAAEDAKAALEKLAEKIGQ